MLKTVGKYKISDDEKEKGDPNVQSSTSGKTKKKKKKKKKQGEEGPTAQDTEDLEREAGDDFQEESPAVRVPEADERPFKTVLTSEPDKHDDSRPVTVFIEPPVNVSLATSQKIPVHVPQKEADVSTSNKQNSVPPPLQTKSEESWESPKQVKKKKKARRET